MKTSDISDIAVCMAAAEYNHRRLEPNTFLTTVLKERFSTAPIKVIFSAIMRSNRKRYLDYGVSARTSWLTDKGKELLRHYAATRPPKLGPLPSNLPPGRYCGLCLHALADDEDLLEHLELCPNNAG